MDTEIEETKDYRDGRTVPESELRAAADALLWTVDSLAGSDGMGQIVHDIALRALRRAQRCLMVNEYGATAAALYERR